MNSYSLGYLINSFKPFIEMIYILIAMYKTGIPQTINIEKNTNGALYPAN